MNNYHIYEVLGRGRQSVLYKGRKKKTVEYYAIKSVEKGAKAAVMAEVKILHALRHINVMRFFNWYETNNHIWLILEYCVGGDLRGLLRQDGRLPESAIRAFAAHLVVALRYIHSRGVVYGDLKPQNIVYDENSVLKLSSFKLAKHVSEIRPEGAGYTAEEDGSNEDREKSGVGTSAQLGRRKGSSLYMAPEIFLEGGVQSFQSDAWALGCVLFEMATGAPPFAAPTMAELIRRIQEDDTPSLPPGEFSPEFEDLLFRLLEKDPYLRLCWHDAAGGETVGIEAHPFFTELGFELGLGYSLPKQPAFEGFLERQAFYPAAVDEDAEMEELIHSGEDLLSSIARPLAKGQPDSTSPPITGRFSGRRAIDRNHERAEILRLSTPEATPRGPEGGDNTSTWATHENDSMATGNVPPGRNDALEKKFSESSSDGENEDLGERYAVMSRHGGHRSLEEDHGEGVPTFTPRVESPIFHVHRQASDSPIPENMGDAAPSRIQPDNQSGRSSFATAMTSTEEAGTLSMNENVSIDVNAASDSPAGARRLFSLDHGESLLISPAGVAYLESKTRVSSQLSTTADIATRTTMAEANGNEGVLDTLLPTPRSDQGRQSRESPYVAASDLTNAFWHPSDRLVKPIVANRRIERPILSTFDPTSLPFQPLSSDEVLGLSHQELEDFLNVIYRGVSGSSGVGSSPERQGAVGQTSATSNVGNERLNTLGYFEATLCTETSIANIVFNSQLMHLFAKILRQSKNVQLRTRLCSVVGLLLRHATYIDQGVVRDIGLVELLGELVRENVTTKQEKLRRKAVSALGELLFYVATHCQQQVASLSGLSDVGRAREESRIESAWGVTSSSVSSLEMLLRRSIGRERNYDGLAMSRSNSSLDVDYVALHYVIKTMENVATCEGAWGLRFATTENALSLVRVFMESRAEGLRSATASTIARLVRQRPSLASDIAGKFGITWIVTQGLEDGGTRSRQAFLGILATLLVGHHLEGGPSAAIRAELVNEKKLLPAIVSCVDSASPVLRGKGLIVLGFLSILVNHRYVAIAVRKFQVVLLAERLVTRDEDLFAKSAGLAFVRCCGPLVSSILANMRPEVCRLSGTTRDPALADTSDVSRESPGRSRGDKRSRYVSGDQQTYDALVVYPRFIFAIVSSPAFRREVVTEKFVEDIGHLLSYCAEGGSVLALGDLDGSLACTRGDDNASNSPVVNIMNDRKLLEAAGGFRSTLLSIAETLAQDIPLILGVSRVIAESVLPALARLLSSDSGDTRCLSLAIIAFILQAYLIDPRIYTPKIDPLFERRYGDIFTPREEIDPAHARRSSIKVDDATEALQKAILLELLPRCDGLLDDKDPIPVYVLKMLAGVLGKDGLFVIEALRLGMLSRFVSFLDLEHSHNNVHNMRLVLILLSDPDACMDACITGAPQESTVGVSDSYGPGSMTLPDRIADVLRYAFHNGVQPFYEPALRIVLRCLDHVASLTVERNGTWAENQSEEMISALLAASELPLISCVDIFVQLCYEFLAGLEEDMRGKDVDGLDGDFQSVSSGAAALATLALRRCAEVFPYNFTAQVLPLTSAVTAVYGNLEYETGDADPVGETVTSSAANEAAVNASHTLELLILSLNKWLSVRSLAESRFSSKDLDADTKWKGDVNIARDLITHMIATMEVVLDPKYAAEELPHDTPTSSFQAVDSARRLEEELMEGIEKVIARVKDNGPITPPLLQNPATTMPTKIGSVGASQREKSLSIAPLAAI